MQPEEMPWNWILAFYEPTVEIFQRLKKGPGAALDEYWQVQHSFSTKCSTQASLKYQCPKFILSKMPRGRFKLIYKDLSVSSFDSSVI